MRWRIGGLMNWIINYVLRISCYTSIKDKFDIGIFMSRENNQSRDAVVADLKNKIDQELALSALGDVSYCDAPSQITYLQPDDYKELALYALEKNKMKIFDFIAKSQSEELAQELQLAKFKKEIDGGKTPNIKATISYTEKRQEDRGDVGGYMSGPQDYQRREIEEYNEIVPCKFSSEHQIALVTYAQQKKPDIAKQLVVQLSNDDLKKFSAHQTLGETVSDEIKKREKEEQKQKILTKLATLKDNLEGLKKEYEGRSSCFFWNSANADKKAEAGKMIIVVTQLQNLLNGRADNNIAWTFDEMKPALADKKTLHGHALILNKLKTDVEKFMPPAPSAAAAAHSK